MYYVHLILDEGFFPHPDEIEDALDAEYRGIGYISAYERGIVAVVPTQGLRDATINAMRLVLHVAKCAYKRTEHYKYKINTKWRKF